MRTLRSAFVTDQEALPLSFQFYAELSESLVFHALFHNCFMWKTQFRQKQQTSYLDTILC